MTPDQPFVIETTALITMRTLVYADSLDTADDIAAGRHDEFVDTITERLGVQPDHPLISFDSEARAALHREVEPVDPTDPPLDIDLPRFDFSTEAV